MEVLKDPNRLGFTTEIELSLDRVSVVPMLMHAKLHRIVNRTMTAGRLAAANRMLPLWAATVMGLSAIIGSNYAAETPVLSEYQVKALFLFNFAKYVDWPTNAFIDGHAAIVIGLVGQDNFGGVFAEMIAGKSLNGRPVVIRHVGSDPEYKDCQILFVSASEKARLPEILNAVRDSAMVTVGETEQFLTQGGMINFTKKANKIHLEINLDAARHANLKLSSKLLSVADVVLGKSGEPK